MAILSYTDSNNITFSSITTPQVALSVFPFGYFYETADDIQDRIMAVNCIDIDWNNATITDDTGKSHNFNTTGDVLKYIQDNTHSSLKNPNELLFTINGDNTSAIAYDGSSKTSINLYGDAGISISTTTSGVKIAHSNSSITSGSVGLSDDSTSTSFTIPYLSYDKYGHITSAIDHTVTLPTSTESESSNIITSSATLKTNAAVTALDNRVFLNHLESSSGKITSSHSIVGTGLTTVSSDELGNLSINTESPTITDEKTTYTGHYDIVDSNDNGSSKIKQSASGGNEVDISDTTTQVVTGVTIKKDGKGHIISMSVSSAGVKSTNTDTSVTSADNHYTPKRAKTILATGGGTATWDSTQMVTGIDVDAKGHVVGVSSIKMPANPDTHYTSSNVITSSDTSTSNTSTGLINGEVYLNHIEGNSDDGTSYMSVTSSHKISGYGATSVSTDQSANIYISSSDTKVTSVDNHYTPIADSSSTLTASSTTAATWGSTSVVTGLSRDAKGHVVGVSSTMMPNDPTTTIVIAKSKDSLIDNGSESAFAYINTIANGAVTSSHSITVDGNLSLTGSADNKSLTISSPITLNGSTVKSPSFYAPTSAGTSGQILTSTGGEPSWTTPISGYKVSYIQSSTETQHIYADLNTTCIITTSDFTLSGFYDTNGSEIEPEYGKEYNLIVFNSDTSSSKTLTINSTFGSTYEYTTFLNSSPVGNSSNNTISMYSFSCYQFSIIAIKNSSDNSLINGSFVFIRQL